MSAYAPTNQKDFEIRHAFYTQAFDFIQSQRAHGPTFTLGDFNARLHHRQAGEESVLGAGVFGNAGRNINSTANRALLFELCTSLDAFLANTWLHQPEEYLVTYGESGVTPLDNISTSKFAQLDHILAPLHWENTVLRVYSGRTAPLRSHHFCLLMELDIQTPVAQPRKRE